MILDPLRPWQFVSRTPLVLPYASTKPLMHWLGLLGLLVVVGGCWWLLVVVGGCSCLLVALTNPAVDLQTKTMSAFDP